MTSHFLRRHNVEFSWVGATSSGMAAAFCSCWEYHTSKNANMHTYVWYKNDSTLVCHFGQRTHHSVRDEGKNVVSMVLCQAPVSSPPKE